jgi:hypothetical protein
MTNTPDEASEETPSETPGERDRRSFYSHPLAAVGGSIVVAGLFAFAVLAAIDITAPAENPYRSIVTFLGLPILIAIGAVLFLIAMRIQVVRARRAGEKVRFVLRVEPSDPKYMRNLWLFLGLSTVFVGILAWGGFQGYETTDSVSFCGETCHEVMEPQNVTYHNSPHARVACTECHIGPGADFWVKSKIDGLRQVWAVATNSFERPIPTPVASLRPARETCEECHWPDQFYGQHLVSHTYYQTDEANSPWTISMLLNIGGGNPRTGELEGIHWHVSGNNVVEYIAEDEKRQEIKYVRFTDGITGEVKEYIDPDAVDCDPEDPANEVRVMDCIDCHNRPSHSFEPPATALNNELADGTIAADLPFIRKAGLELLNAEYEKKDEALAAIEAGLGAFYATEYPDVAASRAGEIDAAADAMQDIYENNFFPEMKTDYRARENNLSHFVNDGCFRCHLTDLQTSTGETISAGCDSCHVIVAQGASDDLGVLEESLTGLDFVHPVDIGGIWQTVKCTQCHNPSQGY